MVFEIAPASWDDLPEIARLEQSIEGENGATLATLQERFLMYGPGFLAARFQGRLIGYAESCIWDLQTPAFRSEAGYFSNLHQPNGPYLYLIFVGVIKEFRKQGAGSHLVQGLQDLARQEGRQKMQAVTWPHLIHFYQSLGFMVKKEIPAFLPGNDHYSLLEWDLS